VEGRKFAERSLSRSAVFDRARWDVARAGQEYLRVSVV